MHWYYLNSDCQYNSGITFQGECNCTCENANGNVHAHNNIGWCGIIGQDDDRACQLMCHSYCNNYNHGGPQPPRRKQKLPPQLHSGVGSGIQRNGRRSQRGGPGAPSPNRSFRNPSGVRRSGSGKNRKK